MGPTSEFAENLVATVVDVSSILFAYSLGVQQLGFTVGLGYAFLDAYLVVWQRRRLTRVARALTHQLRFLNTRLRH